MIIEFLGGPLDGQRDNAPEPDPYGPLLPPPTLDEVRYRITERFTRDGIARIFEFVKADDHE